MSILLSEISRSRIRTARSVSFTNFCQSIFFTSPAPGTAAYSRRMTPSRTVAIWGRLSGLTIVAMMLPPKAGRIW